jgi:type III pantothenate kinase
MLGSAVLLAVDVGNTQTHFGAYDGDRLVEHWRFATVRTSTSDELGAALRSLLALRGLSFDDIDASIVSSTVPQLRPEWTAMAARYLGHEMPVVGPGVRTGMPIRIDNPRELGADRLVNAVAAYERVGGPVVVVDLGTALTFDVVSASGEYIGGIIAPGVEISMEALTARAAAIPKIDLDPPKTLIGKGTVDAIRSGVIYGFAGQVDAIVTRLRGELGPSTEAIATGGLAGAIVPFCDTIDDVDVDLTLDGLRIIWQRNQDG